MHGANSFPTAAAGDRILTVKGDEAAYIASGRWVSAATVLFDEAETRAFETAGAPVRLIPRGHAASAPLSLRLDVQTFEVRYAPRTRTPTVVISVTAELTRPGDRELVAAKTFEVAKPASENRVGAIVTAFDEATSDVLGQVVGWTATRGGADLAGGR
jgi:cholesterol transport system auxiliary component